MTDLVMTCPVEWGAGAAADTAGRGRTGAAAAYFTANLHHDVPIGRSVIVYDLGGGTFDVCVVRREATGFEPLAYRGVDDLGGIDLDALVVAQIAAAVQPSAPDEWKRLSEPQDPADRRHFRTLWDDARNAKKSLSRQAIAHVLVPIPGGGELRAGARRCHLRHAPADVGERMDDPAQTPADLGLWTSKSHAPSGAAPRSPSRCAPARPPPPWR
ncbi:Hsp70 family protein [Phytomonospora sp. NPDC050363]|uniref:Hsp70 family protein n=1 Tax=Phytomonospora sp. NPDC050363 TaxID=3155642 RepID=UPI0033CA7125